MVFEDVETRRTNRFGPVIFSMVKVEAPSQPVGVNRNLAFLIAFTHRYEENSATDKDSKSVREHVTDVRLWHVK
jgi:hypothetical protein